MSELDEKGNVLENEIICISRWRCEHDDHRDQPMFEETGEWRVEGLVTGPKLGEWEETFAANFLNHYCDVSLA